MCIRITAVICTRGLLCVIGVTLGAHAQRGLLCVSVCYRSICIGFSWISTRGFSKKPSLQKLWREKANMQIS